MAICPYCEMHVTLNGNGRDRVVAESTGALKKETMYSCPHCNKVLGFAFFFGGFATGRP